MPIKKQISKQYNYTVQVPKAGLVAIFVSARCKSKKQINSNVDEDLRVEINGARFREIPPRKYVQLFNIPPAFNGSKLKGLKKTVVFLTVLNQGEHIISLIPKNSAFIEEIKIKELGNVQNIKLEIEEQAADGDRRPWYTFALIDLPLKSFSAEVTVERRFWDSDDVKIIVDNNIKKNVKGGKYKFWYLIAGPLGWIIWKIKGAKKREKVDFDELLDKGIHYIEFWVDRMPILHWVEFDLGEIEIPKGEKARVVWGTTRLREEAKIEDDNILIEEIKKGEEVRVLEKAVKGERPKNRKGEFLFSDRWHRVRYEEQEGYIYSEALEIEGEDKETIKKTIQEKSKELDEDAALMLAVAERESQFLPYTVAQHEIYEKAGKSVMQINDITAKWVRESKAINYDIRNIFDIKQNTEGGIRYFNYLRSFYKKDDPEYLEKLLIAWNCGPNCIEPEDRDKPIDYSRFSKKVKQFVEDAKRFYERNKKKN